MMNESSRLQEYKIAATEVLSILDYLPQNEVNKIPNNFRDFLIQNSNLDYKPNFDYSLGLNKLELRPKTKLLLAMIYKNYICSEEEKIEYDKILYQNEEIYQKQLKEIYNPDNMFKKSRTNNVEAEEVNDVKALIEYRETFFTKFKNFIFKILHINK